MIKKIITDIKTFSKRCYEQGENSSGLISSASKLRLATLRNLINKVDNKVALASELEKVSKRAAETNTLPVYDGIPITDLVLYANKLLRSGPESAHLNNAIIELSKNKDILSVPSFISVVTSPEGDTYLPSFGEIVLDTNLTNYSHYTNTKLANESANDFIRAAFIDNVIHGILDNLNDMSVNHSDNFHLARAYIRAVKYEELPITLIKESENQNGLSQKSLSQALAYELSTCLYTTPEPYIENAIKSAYKNGVALGEIRTEDDSSIDEVTDMLGYDSAGKTNSYYEKKQIVEEVAMLNEHRLDTDFNPTAYFDI